ncbi:MAG: acetylxylan esterase [Verrucomicrobiae bacterium]|nr:acetylxylan esterase [Verrucomicrobiae bacterium]
MKKIPFLNLLAVCVFAISGLHAFGKPAKDPAKDFIITVKTDRPEALYHCGEQAGFRIEATEAGQPVSEGQVDVTLTLDGGKILEKKSLNFNQSPLLIAGTLSEPGFLRCTAIHLKDKKTIRGYGGAGFDPEKIKPAAVMPDDFDAFWNEGRAELAKIPLDLKLKPLPEHSNEKRDCFLLSFANLDNTRMYGFLGVPKEAKPPFPAYLTVQPAGENPSKPSGLEWGAKGVLVLHMGVHDYEVGLPPEETKARYAKINNISTPPIPYMYIGSPDRQRCYFRKVILGVDRAIEYLTSRPDFNGKQLVAHGSSQGGGMSLIMAGFNRKITAVGANVPALCDQAGHLANRQGGWPQFIRRTATDEEKAAQLKMAPYFDAVNFARKIQCPAIVSVGFIDTTCSPSSVYSAYNEIQAPKKMFIDPMGGHIGIKPFYAFLPKWMEGQLGLGEPIQPTRQVPPQ